MWERVDSQVDCPYYDGEMEQNYYIPRMAASKHNRRLFVCFNNG